MVSEGVDIPRLRLGVFATTTTTELFFRQVVGGHHKIGLLVIKRVDLVRVLGIARQPRADVVNGTVTMRKPAEGFDPDDRMNPGCIVRSARLDADLRLFVGRPRIPDAPQLAFVHDGDEIELDVPAPRPVNTLGNLPISPVR